MSLEQSIQSIVSKLDQLSTRLANIESKLGSGSSSSSSPSTGGGSGSGSGEVPQRVQEYLDNVYTPNIPQLMDIAQKLGGQTHVAV